MCHEATFDGKIYDLAGDLAAVLSAGLVPDPNYVKTQGAAHSIDMDSCLCQLDLTATAERNGYGAWRAELDRASWGLMWPDKLALRAMVGDGDGEVA